MSIADHVEAIAGLMADVESLADGPIKTKLDSVADHIKAIHDDPENANVGSLISKASALRAKGISFDLRAELYSLHSDLTEAAKVRGIELPGIDGGGGR